MTNAVSLRNIRGPTFRILQHFVAHHGSRGVTVEHKSSNFVGHTRLDTLFLYRRVLRLYLKKTVPGAYLGSLGRQRGNASHACATSLQPTKGCIPYETHLPARAITSR